MPKNFEATTALRNGSPFERFNDLHTFTHSRKARCPLSELAGLFLHSLLQSFLFGDALFGGVFRTFLRYLHAAKVWPAHGTGMSRLRSFLGQGSIMEFSGRDGVEREIELILPRQYP